MHKGVILLVKATDREEALSEVNDFMDGYVDDVWDWFSIGNRWHNTLAPTEKVKKFTKIVNRLYPQTKGGYALNEIENEEVRQIIQAEWEKLGLRGRNTFWSAYGFGLEDTKDDYNVVPLQECLKTVKKWVRDLGKEAEEYHKKMEEARIEEKQNGGGTMSAYYAELYKDATYNNFCFDSNVYDITEGVGEQLPKNVGEYYAVMVDMHN